MANVTVTTGANFIPELWSSAILDYAERAFSLRDKVSDFSSMVAGGGDIITAYSKSNRRNSRCKVC